MIMERKYAIVDVETTGGNATDNKIIEIAIFIHDGIKVIDEFETLINPERPIPPYIASFTGINEEMVRNAPTFAGIIDRVEEITTDCIFVAHNVNFDYSFLRKEYSELGRTFKRKKLCTVRTARQLIPDLPSYGLGGLCNSLGITINGRHRAGGDGRATARLWTILMRRDNYGFVENALKASSREALLPPNLEKAQFERLPESIGVYYFLDRKGNIIYIGKAKNLRNRVTSHFQGNTNTRTRQLFMEKIHGLDFVVCGNELVALLLESEEIKKHWPEFNRAQKRYEQNYGIFRYEDINGYQRLTIGRNKSGYQPILTFPGIIDARSYLFKRVREFKLCPKLCGLQKSPHECHDHKVDLCNGACGGHEPVEEYNARLEEAIQSMLQGGKSFAIIGQGRTSDESSIVVVENGSYLGYGYSEGPLDNDLENLKQNINHKDDNPDIQMIINSYVNRVNPANLIEF